MGDEGTPEDDEHFSSVAESMKKDEYEEFDDYLEMIIDFGYVTLFAGAMPLGSFITIVSNVAELFSDNFKLHKVVRRPEAQRTANMPKTWFYVMGVMAYVAIITNVVFTFVGSEQLFALVGG